MKKTANKTAKKAAKKTAAKSAVKQASTISSGEKSITRLNREVHSYEGFNVRLQKTGTRFQKYVSASEKSAPGLSENARYAGALQSAVADRDALKKILDNKNNWLAEGETTALSEKAYKAITKLGFRISNY